MRSIVDFIFRLLGLDYQNMIPEVPVLAGLIWLLMAICAVFSIRTQGMFLGGKIAWMLVVLLIPLLGVAAYAVYCLTRQDYSFLKIFSGGQIEKSKNTLTG